MDRVDPKRLTRSILLVALPFLLPSCSDNATSVDPENALTQAEALAVAGQLGIESLTSGRSQSASPASGAPQAGASRTQTVSVTYDVTRPCLLGGTVDSSGQIDVETDTLTDLAVVDLTATEVHHSCAFLAAGTRVEVTGDPDVTTTIHVASLAGEPQGTQSVSVVGGVRYVTDDGRQGRCDLDILVEVNQDTQRQTTRGDFCGFSFDVTVQG